jgi:hypothetical protein
VAETTHVPPLKDGVSLTALLQALAKSDAGLFQDRKFLLQGLDPANDFVQPLKTRFFCVAERVWIKLNIIIRETSHGGASHKKNPPSGESGSNLDRYVINFPGL